MERNCFLNLFILLNEYMDVAWFIFVAVRPTLNICIIRTISWKLLDSYINIRMTY